MSAKMRRSRVSYNAASFFSGAARFWPVRLRVLPPDFHIRIATKRGAAQYSMLFEQLQQGIPQAAVMQMHARLDTRRAAANRV